jgi:drug/metabolite transporter (DMT)-like permease
MERKQQLGGALCLLLAAVVWGFGFVAQDMGAEHVGGFTFQACRTLLAALALLILWQGRDLYKRKKGTYVPMSREEKKYLLIGGPVCGIILCAASGLQQLGIGNNEGSPGKEAFITALYIVLVPLLSLAFGKRAKPHVYACVGVAMLGLWMLCMSGSELTTGDIQCICCAFIFACHILSVEHFIPHVDGLRLSCIQFFTTCVGATVMMFIFEEPAWSGISAASLAILYSGVVSAGAGYTLQILGQKNTPATLASLLMSLESVFAVVASAILLPEITTFTWREVVGMVIIFAAIICSQLNLDFKKKTKTV